MDNASITQSLSPQVYSTMSLPAYLQSNDYSPRTPLTSQSEYQSSSYAHDYTQSTPELYTNPSQVPQGGYFGAKSAQYQDFLPPPPYQPTVNSQTTYSNVGQQAVTPGLTPPGLTPAASPDDMKSNWGKRFVGNMLVTRGVRATWQSTGSSLKLPTSLSPWGDNNPITLPNVRVRDIVLFAGTTFGADVIVSGLDVTLDFAGQLLQEVICAATESAAEEVLEPFMPGEEFVLQTTSVKSIRIKIEHKLMGVDANLGFFELRECPWLQRGSAAKGWFCPYLYASGRRPSISRAQDFAVAQCFGPHLNGKHLLLGRISVQC